MRSFLLATLLLLGCAAPQGQTCQVPPPQKKVEFKHNVQVHKKVHLDTRFTSSELRVIEDAAKAWSTASDGVVEYDLIPGLKLDFNSTPPNMMMIARMKSTDPTLARLGIEDDVASGIMILPGTVLIVLVIDRIKTTEDLKVHVLRNLGADLGIPSFRGKYPAVMNSDMDVSCLTKFDMILFCTKYVCDWKETNYCESVGSKNKVEEL